MRLSALAIASLLVVSACALRPRYNDFITADTKGPDVRFVVIDTDTNKPVSGAKVEVSEFKNRIIATTKDDGTFVLPVDKKYTSENPIFVVTLPKGVTEYRVEIVKEAAVAPQPIPTPVPTTVIATPTENVGTIVEVNDAGVPPSTP